MSNVNPNYISDDVMEAICNNMDLDSGEESTYRKIAKLTPTEAFNKFLIWHGIIGYTHKLINAWESIKASAEEEPYE
jgi:hypothetical protein